MPRFLIEVPHEAREIDCALAIQIFLKTGSHWLTNAEWGCLDGDHKGWIVVELESKEEARRILPSAFRDKAKIVQLNRFTMEAIEEIIRCHQE